MNNTLYIIAGFGLYFIGFKYFEPIMLLINQTINYKLISYFITYLLIGIPVFLVCSWITNKGSVIDVLGLKANPLKGLIFSIIVTLPLLIGGIFFSQLANSIKIPTIIAKTIFDPFFEELYFRAYFFGLLFRFTKLGFIPSILICSVIFAAGHLYQSTETTTLLGIFITTFLGSVLFAWLYAEWSFNIWIPVFLHVFMNLYWHLFELSTNAFGNLNANIFRGLSIALSIIITLIYKRRNKLKLTVNKSTLIRKPVYIYN